MENYLINEEYDFKGTWFFPNDDTNIIFSGALRYRPKEKFSILEVWSEKRLDFDVFREKKVFHGNTVKGEKLTLINFFCQTVNTTSGGQNLTLYEFHVYGSILIGKYYNDLSELRFGEVYYQFSGLENFITKKYVQSKFHDSGLEVSYEHPDDVILLHKKDIEHKIIFTYSNNPFGRNVKILSKEYFCLKNENKYSISESMDYLKVLNGFLLFFTNEKSHPTEMYAIDNEEQICILNQFYRDPKMEELSEGLAYPSLCILSDENVKQNYINWISLYVEQKTAMDKYFLLIQSSKYFVEESFLIYTQLFEELHRKSDKLVNLKEGDLKHEKKMSAILDSCPEEYKSWLMDKLKYSNEIYFRKRISNVLKKYITIFTVDLKINSKDKDRIISKIVETRNYYTHGSEEAYELAEKSMQGVIILTKLLKVMIDCIILSKLGYDDENVNKSIHTKSEFYYLLCNVQMHNIDWSKLVYK